VSSAAGELHDISGRLHGALEHIKDDAGTVLSTISTSLGRLNTAAECASHTSKLAAKNSRVARLLETKTTDNDILDELYLNALSRHPKDFEKRKMLTALAAAAESEHRLALEDVYWAVLSSKEFLFNH